MIQTALSARCLGTACLIITFCGLFAQQPGPFPAVPTNDASGILYRGPGSSVSRTQWDRNTDIVSVRDYGADPTGNNDSTAAFTTCANRTPIGVTNGVVQCYVPAGTWRITGTIGTGYAVTWVLDAAASITGTGTLPGTTFRYSNSGGSTTFDKIGSGTNTSATMTCGTGCSMGTSGTGTILGCEQILGIFCPASVTGGDKGAGTINTAGLYVNGSAVVQSFNGDGALLSNNSSNGSVTAAVANAGSYSLWGNSSSSSGPPGYTSTPAVSSLTLEGSTSASCPITVAATGGTANICGAMTVTTGGSISVSSGNVGPISNYTAVAAGTIGTANATTYYLMPGGAAFTFNLSTAQHGVPMPASCTAKNFTVLAGTGPTGSGGTVTLYKDGSATSIACTLSSGSAANCQDTTHTVSFTANHTWAIGVLTTQASDTTAFVTASFQCQ